MAGAPWLADAVVYEIFVDSFARRDPPSGCGALAPWGAPPRASAFMGGNLAGIVDRLDYLQDLGVNVLYLTPIFLSTANHRYHTCDYFRIDPRLGTLRDFRRLLRAVHARGLRLILDGVFNHCGRGFFPFVDVMENGSDSAFADWFYVSGFPVDAYGLSRARGWLGAAEVPEINLANPQARAYMLRAAEFWTRQGIDGWRLDAVAHVEHRAFWPELCAAVRRIKPDAYLLAEIWEDPTPWLAAGDFDGATSYQLRDCVIEFVCARTATASRFAAGLTHALNRPAAAMCNLVGSHDTPRLWRVAGGHVERVKMAFALLFTLPGIPLVYYGDEIGLDGGDDPDNRRAFPWDPSLWSLELLSTVQTWTRVRRTVAALRTGTWETVCVDDERDLCVFLRMSAADRCLIVVHRGTAPASIELPLPVKAAADSYVDVQTGCAHPALDSTLRLESVPPDSVTVLKAV